MLHIDMISTTHRHETAVGKEGTQGAYGDQFDCLWGEEHDTEDKALEADDQGQSEGDNKHCPSPTLGFESGRGSGRGADGWLDRIIGLNGIPDLRQLNYEQDEARRRCRAP